MPITRDKSQAQAAYQRIKHNILTGRFNQQTRLRELEVAELLGLGRTPVRESLKRLQDEGLLTQEPRRGLVVTSLDAQAVHELYAMRQVLEGAAAAFAAQHATAAEIANMASILADAEAGGEPVALNLEFHEAIYAAAHNRHLIRSLQSITDSTYLLGQSTLASPERAQVANAEHAAILDAFRRRDAEAARAAAESHIQQALSARLRLLRQRQKEAAEPRS
ncbi:FCD domain-containing protein [Xylophilus rhododendri]|uniref:FCD domain-containing protein n=1 Tax=Xylophilus rhododendri TaxID=2697032 RepID=A0A857J3G7_9BURK|nr:GntR family transcriptional regulator [Xylophilus rhododendri]QHI98464.1 FCD domain-containing protein [Xylophilus rhododendri]